MKTAEELANQLVQLYSHQGVTALAATELRRLAKENETLSARVQEVGEMARENRSRRVVELETSLADAQKGVAPVLAADHQGMRVDYSGLLSQCQYALKRDEPGYAEMLRQLQGHLKELGQRWYAGDTNVVDEILQLYCIEHDTRTKLKQAAENPDSKMAP